MDQTQCNSLWVALQRVPDPRARRGRRYPWWWILGLLGMALVAGQRSVRGSAHWIALHRQELVAWQGGRETVPSEPTLRRALQQVDQEWLRALLGVSGWMPASRAGHRRRGMAVDGKALCGAQAHGVSGYLVSAVWHGSGGCVGQVLAAGSEAAAAGQVLAGCDLRDVVVTGDAGLTQRVLAQQILDQGGDYLLEVKGNQPRVQEDTRLLFASPAAETRHIQVTKGHGRLEQRIVRCRAVAPGYPDWPGARQVVCRRRISMALRTGRQTDETQYAVTSLAPEEADAEDLARLWRGHWTIENRVHYVRDETLGEDRCQVHTGMAPQALVALRNVVLALVRRAGWGNVAEALRYYDANLQENMHLLGPLPL